MRNSARSTRFRLSCANRLTKKEVKKDGKGRPPGGVRYALAYPNRREVGMGNLGLQTVYSILSSRPGARCELYFADRERSAATHERSLEFDVVALSLSFEGDYPSVAPLLKARGVEPRAERRGEGQPIVLAGGMAPSLNPEPMAAIADVIYLGEAEPSLERLHQFFCEHLGEPRRKLLERLAAEALPGVYVPAAYEWTGEGHTPRFGAPLRVALQKAKPGWEPAHSGIIEKGDAFGGAYLLEISRGCPHGCLFCAAGHLLRPARFIKAEQLLPYVAEGVEKAGRVGFVGAAVSDHPEFKALAEAALDRGGTFGVSSYRVENIDREALELLKRGGLRTLTVALEAGSEALRARMGKKLTDGQLISAAALAKEAGINSLRVYAMVGLPTETDEDVAALAALAVRVKKELGRGGLTLSVAPFIPKPHTPFQLEPFAGEKVVSARMRMLKAKAAPKGIDVVGESPKWASVQALFSRGSRWVGELLAEGVPSEEWVKIAKSERGVEALSRWSEDAPLPWGIASGGPSRGYLTTRACAGAEATLRCPSPGCDCGACDD